MANSFLWEYFRQGLFPSKVLTSVIETYGPRYGGALAQNRALNQHALDLLPFLDDEERCVLVSKSGNAAAIDALLGCPTTSPAILAEIAYCWRLSATDQRRLLERDLADLEFRKVLVHVELTNYVAKIWKRRFDYDPSTHNLPTEKRPPRVSAPKKKIPVLTSDEAGGFYPHTIAELANTVSGLNLYYRFFIKYLGDGSTKQSLDAWHSFFVLAKSDPDIQLKSVLRTASRLALAA